eukprot:4233324-Pleurochrysis_carterae.AAC.1
MLDARRACDRQAARERAAGLSGGAGAALEPAPLWQVPLARAARGARAADAARGLARRQHPGQRHTGTSRVEWLALASLRRRVCG